MDSHFTVLCFVICGTWSGKKKLEDSCNTLSLELAAQQDNEMILGVEEGYSKVGKCFEKI